MDTLTPPLRPGTLALAALNLMYRTALILLPVLACLWCFAPDILLLHRTNFHGLPTFLNQETAYCQGHPTLLAGLKLYFGMAWAWWLLTKFWTAIWTKRETGQAGHGFLSRLRWLRLQGAELLLGVTHVTVLVCVVGSELWLWSPRLLQAIAINATATPRLSSCVGLALFVGLWNLTETDGNYPPQPSQQD